MPQVQEVAQVSCPALLCVRLRCGRDFVLNLCACGRKLAKDTNCKKFFKDKEFIYCKAISMGSGFFLLHFPLFQGPELVFGKSLEQFSTVPSVLTARGHC